MQKEARGSLLASYRAFLLHLIRLADGKAYSGKNLKDVGLDNLSTALARFDKESDHVIEAKLRMGSNNTQPLNKDHFDKNFCDPSKIYKWPWTNEQLSRVGASRITSCLRDKNIEDLIKHSKTAMWNPTKDNVDPETDLLCPIANLMASDSKPNRTFQLWVRCSCPKGHTDSPDCVFTIVERFFDLHKKDGRLFGDVTHKDFERFRKGWGKDVGLTKVVSHHQLRVTMPAHASLRAGWEAKELMRIMNHKNERITQGYMQKEIPGMSFNSSLLKRLTGSDTLSCRALYSNDTKVRLMCSLFCESNDLPHIEECNFSVFRRTNIIEFKSLFGKTHNPSKHLFLADPELESRIKNNEYRLPLLEKLLQYYGKPLKVPKKIKAATINHLKLSDDFYNALKTVAFENPGGTIELEALMQRLKYSDYYNTLTKRAQRKFNIISLKKYLSSHLLLKQYLKNDTLIGWELSSSF